MWTALWPSPSILSMKKSQQREKPILVLEEHMKRVRLEVRMALEVRMEVRMVLEVKLEVRMALEVRLEVRLALEVRLV